MNNEILLIKSNHKDNQEVKLQARDDGNIWVRYPNKSYILADRNICYIGDMSFLILSACEGSRLTFMMPIKLNEERIARDFLDYWGEKRLKGLKESKWLGFLGYWKDVLEYINTLIDFDKYPSKFEYYVDDYTDCDGDFSPQFVVRIPKDVLYDLGLTDEKSFDLLWKLMKSVHGLTIDRHLDGKDEYFWFSKFNISFRYIGED